MVAGSGMGQVALGGALVATPWWASAMEIINYSASTVAVICGALIGIHGVFRIATHYLKRWRS